MTSAPCLSTVSMSSAAGWATDQSGGGGATTTFNSGSVGSSDLSAIPSRRPSPLSHLKESDGRTAAFASVLDMLAVETAAPGLGADAAVARLFELLFIHAIRAYARDDGSPKRGWLAAVSDHRLKSVIEAIDADPARDWTIDALARTAGMSRSAFAVHFKNARANAAGISDRVACALRFGATRKIFLDDIGGSPQGGIRL